MFGALKGLLADLAAGSPPELREPEQRQLHLAVAGLLQEMMRADLKEKAEEDSAMRRALTAIFGLDAAAAQALLAQSAAHRFTSYFGPVSIIKRMLSREQRVVLVEQLWQVAFSDGELDLYEDHFVRKIAHLLYVSNTECVLARQRARHAN
jgi:uncharacterized tellurite resistance protein B-like protein